VETLVLEVVDDERTRVVATALFHTAEERDGMLHSGMADGVAQSYDALDRVLQAMS
jgi:uncharacterized protein YndB with AHSA1/START domain